MLLTPLWAVGSHQLADFIPTYNYPPETKFVYTAEELVEKYGHGDSLEKILEEIYEKGSYLWK